MSELSRGSQSENPSDNETPVDKDKDPKKRKKDAPALSRLSLIGLDTERQPAQPARPARALGELSAGLFGKRAEKQTAAADVAEAKDSHGASTADNEAAPGVAAAESHTTAPAESLEPGTESTAELPSADTAQTSPDVDFRELNEYKLPPGARYAGEVIIELEGEGEIPLYRPAEVVAADPAELAQFAEVAEAHARAAQSAPQEAPQWRMQQQPEQQHQARSEPAPAERPEPAPHTPVGGEQSPEPAPQMPPSVFDMSPHTSPRPRAEAGPIEPAEAYRRYAQRHVDTENIATKQDVEEGIDRAANAGRHKWVTRGLLVGGVYEHFKHKRRERKAEKRYKAQSKKLNAAQRNYEFGQRENQRQQSEATNRFNTAERRFQDAQKNMEARVVKAEQAAATATADAEARLNVPADHRLETSAWHAIEVDTKTGKAVEKPSFVYGREYYRERAQEGTPVDQRTTAVAAAAVAGTAAASTQGIPQDNTATTAAGIPNASMQGPPPAAPRPTDDLRIASGSEPRQGHDSGNSTAPLWPWVVALVGVTICLVIALS